MSWLNVLSNTSAVLQITANVIVIYYVFPAYHQTRQRAFVLIGAACMIGAFDTICDHTVGRYPMAHDTYLLYRTLRWLTHVVATVLDVIGIVLLTQSYLRLLQSKMAPPPTENMLP